MSQLLGPVGAGATDPYYTTDQFEKEQKQLEEAKAAEQKQLEQQQGEAGPKTVNPLEGVANVVKKLNIGDVVLGSVDKALKTNFQEGYRAVRSIPVEAIESTLDTLDLTGDVIKAGLLNLAGQKVKPTEDPFSDRYTAAAYSLGLAKPKTQLGQAATKLGGLIFLARTVAVSAPKALIQLGTKGVGLKGAVASGLVPGAVADFMLTSKEDGNFSQMVQNFFPEDSPIKDSFIFALASDETDDIFTAKLKGTLEGGVFSAVSDGLLFLMFGRKAAQAAKKAGKSDEEALAEGLKAADTKAKEIETEHTKAVEVESQRWGEAHQLEIQETMDLQNRYSAQLDELDAAGVPPTDPQYVAVNKAFDTANQKFQELDEAISRGYEPDNARELLPQEAAARVVEGDPDKAIAQQYKNFKQNPAKFDIPGIGGGSVHMLTDAQFRISNITGSVEDLIRSTSKREDLQKAAAEAKTSVNNIVRAAAQDLQFFRSAIDGETSNEQLLDLMKQADLIDPENITGRVLSKKGIVVTKSLIRDTGLQIDALAKNSAALRAAGELDGNTFDRLVDRLVTLLDLHKYTAYKTGSTLDTFKYNAETFDDVADASKGELTRGQVRDWAIRVKQLQRSNDPGAQEELDKLISAMVLAGGDPSKTVRFTASAIREGTQAMMTSMYQSMLSGPITHLRNAFGNSYSLLERPFSTYLRGAFKGDKALRAAAVSGMHSIWKGMGEAWQVAAITLRTGDSVNFNQKFVIDDFETRAMLEQMNLAARTDGEKVAAGILYHTYRTLNNPWLSWPSRALMASDDFFKSLAARYRMNSKAMYEAVTQSSDEAGVDELFEKYIQSYSKGVDPQTGRIVDKDLLDYAERVTFQNDPGSWINSVANAVDRSPLGLGRLFIPFIRTPANLMGYGLEHVPVVSKAVRRFSETYQEAVKSGDALLVAEMEGREATGTLLVMSLLGLALTTDVTGNAPVDQAERQAWREGGRPTMSIKVGDKWVSYASFEPVNSMLSIVADTVRLVKVGGADGASNVLRQLAYSIMVAYTDKSFLSGLSGLGEMLNPQALTDPSGLNFALNTANTVLPYAGVRRAFANALDPYLKETRGELDRMLSAAAPGFGRDMATVTSPITGKKSLSSAGGIFNAVSPVRVYDDQKDPVVNKLTELGYPINTKLKKGDSNVDLLPHQRERLAQILAQSGLRNKLAETFKNPSWKAMAEAYKGRPLSFDMLVEGDEGPAPPHIKEINNIVNKFKKAALRRLFDEDPEYRALVFKERDTQIRASQGNFGPNPELEALLEF